MYLTCPVCFVGKVPVLEVYNVWRSAINILFLVFFHNIFTCGNKTKDYFLTWKTITNSLSIAEKPKNFKQSMKKTLLHYQIHTIAFTII